MENHKEQRNSALLSVLLFVVVFRNKSGQAAAESGVRFRDVSIQAGMKRPFGRRKKYGGAAVADLDGDGWPDLLLGHHDDRYVDLYFNNCDGTFTRYPWDLWVDTHGLNPFRLSPWHQTMHFSVSRGGANGNSLAAPIIYRVQTSNKRGRAIIEVTNWIGVKDAKGRGRSAAFLNLSLYKKGAPDAIFTNAGATEFPQIGRNSKLPNNYGFQSIVTKSNTALLKPRHIRGFAQEPNWYVTVADVNGDGRVELFSMHNLTVYRLTTTFTMQDVTYFVLPRGLDYTATVAIAELDYNNDGLFDLYIARSNTGDLDWLPRLTGPGYTDYLLRNVGGRYVDVSRSAGIPRKSDSRGITVGDFNNDGWTDLLVTRFHRQDLLLLNNGKGKFQAFNAGFRRSSNTRGDMATAVDYDRDGRLDIILSEGHTHFTNQGGYYRIMKNISINRNSYLLIRVGSSPNFSATSLHALVTITLSGGRGKSTNVFRRVSTPGTAVSNSYIELIHVGIGRRRYAAKVMVRWTDGIYQTRRNVLANSLIPFGRF